MPSKKRKYNARFPAGRIKKIMQTDEEVGKVAQAVPIIILLLSPTPRTLELFVESLLSKAMQVTMARNAKTLSPSHVKQCILAESKFDFLRDLNNKIVQEFHHVCPPDFEKNKNEELLSPIKQEAKNIKIPPVPQTFNTTIASGEYPVRTQTVIVKNIPDVSAAEEKEMMSAESSPNSSRFTEMTVPPRRIAREDSNSSSSSDVKIVPLQPPRDPIKRALSTEVDMPLKLARTETITSTSLDTAIDLSKKSIEEKPVITANFYQETLLTDEVQHRSVIKINPTYASPQPSTSYTPEPLKIEMVPKPVIVEKPIVAPRTPVTPITPILNIDFTKNLANPEIKLLDTASINVSVPKKDNSLRQIHRQNSKTSRQEVKKIEIKPVLAHPVDIDSLNSGNLQIDEDYDT